MLKVMRSMRPHQDAPNVAFPINPSGPTGLAAVEMPKLRLPMSLTQSLVGEPFTGYLHVSNVSSLTVNNVSLRVELTIGSAKHVLFNNSASPVMSLPPGEFFDTMVEHDLSHAVTYVLTCHVSYVPSIAVSGEEMLSFKRSYRFPALQPFAVVHRVAQLDTELLVECTVENATSGNIYLAAPRFDPVAGFTAHLVESGSQVDLDHKPEPEEVMHFLMPRGAHSLVYRVRPTVGTDGVAKINAVEVVGNLSLGWRVPGGSMGRVEGHEIRVRPLPAAKGLDVRVAEYPGRVRVEEPFRLEVEVVNRAQQAMEPSLVLDTRSMGVVRVHGLTHHQLGRLEPRTSTRVRLDLLVTEPGLHGLQGVSVVDGLSNIRSDFGVLCDILAF